MVLKESLRTRTRINITASTTSRQRRIRLIVSERKGQLRHAKDSVKCAEKELEIELVLTEKRKN